MKPTPPEQRKSSQADPDVRQRRAPEFLAVGVLGRAHGLKGAVLMKILTHFPERLQPGVTVYVGEEHLPRRIRFARPHRQGMLIGFEGILDREQATTLRHRVVFVRTEEVPTLPEGEYYHHQLLGLLVCSEDGQQLGRLVEILETGANDVYLVRGEGGEEFLLPAIEEVVREVNLSEGIMRVHLLPGL